MKKFPPKLLILFVSLCFFSCEVTVTTPKVAKEVAGTYDVSKVAIQENGQAEQVVEFSDDENSEVKVTIEQTNVVENTNALITVGVQNVLVLVRYIEISKSSGIYSSVSTKDSVTYNLQIIESDLQLIVSDKLRKLTYIASKQN